VTNIIISRQRRLAQTSFSISKPLSGWKKSVLVSRKIMEIFTDVLSTDPGRGMYIKSPLACLTELGPMYSYPLYWVTQFELLGCAQYLCTHDRNYPVVVLEYIHKVEIYSYFHRKQNVFNCFQFRLDLFHFFFIASV